MRYLLILSVFIFIPLNFTLPQEDVKDSLKYEIQEVTILGTRTQEKIIDVPYSVFRVDKEDLVYGRKVSAKDVLADVPGLFLQSRYGNHDLRISLRGFGTRSNSGIRGIRILQDGIPESEPDGESVIDAVDFTGLGGVEVVKGNLSSLYANAPGGIINFISNLYFPENFISYNSQIGNFGYTLNGLKLGIKNANNRIFVSYNYSGLSGFREHSNEYEHLLNAVYESYLEKATLTISGNYVDGINKLPGSLTSQEFYANADQADPSALTFDYRRVTKKGRIGLKYKMILDDADQNEFEITGYGSLKELEKTDNLYYNTSTRYSLGTFVRFSNRSEIFNRMNIITAGMDYAYQSGPVNDFDNISGQKGISILTEYTESLSNIGFYIQDHFNILPDKFDMFLSGRYDNNVFSKDIFIPYGFTDTSRVFGKFAPKAAFNYKLTPNVAIFTSYGIGYDFPALSEMENSPLTSNIKYSVNPDLNVEKSQNFEFGLKGNIINEGVEFMRMVNFDIAFFDYEIYDEIVPFIINQQTYFRNAAKTNRLGIESSFKLQLIDNLEATVNYIYTRFRYDSYKALLYNPGGDTTENFSGNYVPSVPRGVVNLILNYEFEISDRLSGLLQWDCDYVSSLFVGDNNAQKSSPYFTGNMMVGLNFSTNYFNAIFYIGAGNIFDKKYAGFININAYDGRYYETGEPRNYYSGINLSYKL